MHGHIEHDCTSAQGALHHVVVPVVHVQSRGSAQRPAGPHGSGAGCASCLLALGMLALIPHSLRNSQPCFTSLPAPESAILAASSCDERSNLPDLLSIWGSGSMFIYYLLHLFIITAKKPV